MGFSATTIWEVRNGGSDTANGGGFDAGNASFATDLAATSATGSSPVVTSASYNFAAGDVGAWLFIQSGTNWTPGWYQIASVAANAATLTASIGSAVLWNNTTKLPTIMSTAAGCATTASPTGGVWGVDYCQQTSRRTVYTDMVIDGTTNTKYTSAGNPVGVNVIGNVISVTSGTGFTVQYVQVVSVTGTTATCDKSLGTLSSTGGNGGLGGCFATPGGASAQWTTSNIGFVKYSATPYTQTSASTKVASGGTIMPGGASTRIFNLCGYDTNRILTNTDANRPILRAGVNSGTQVASGGPSFEYNRITNFVLDNPSSFSTTTGINLASAKGQAINCSVNKYRINYTTGDLYCSYVNCYSTAGTVNGFVGQVQTRFYGCVSNADVVAFTMSNRSTCIDCIAISPTSNSVDAFDTAGDYSCDFLYCIAYGGAASGFHMGEYGRAVNCIATNNAAYGFRLNGSNLASSQLIYCAGYSNTTANINDFSANNQINFIALSASPWTSAGTDFTLNSTAGGGVLLKSLGYPTTLPGLSPTNYPSVGVYQPTSASAGGTPHQAGRGGGLAG